MVAAINFRRKRGQWTATPNFLSRFSRKS